MSDEDMEVDAGWGDEDGEGKGLTKKKSDDWDEDGSPQKTTLQREGSDGGPSPLLLSSFPLLSPFISYHLRQAGQLLRRLKRELSRRSPSKTTPNGSR
jgi:hypothetical protein